MKSQQQQEHRSHLDTSQLPLHVVPQAVHVHADLPGGVVLLDCQVLARLLLQPVLHLTMVVGDEVVLLFGMADQVCHRFLHYFIDCLNVLLPQSMKLVVDCIASGTH